MIRAVLVDDEPRPSADAAAARRGGGVTVVGEAGSAPRR